MLLQVAAACRPRGLAMALQEIGAGLNPEMLPRMAAFLQNQNDPKLKAEEKLSLAVSGWLLGSDAASTDLPATLSAWRLRGLVQKYLTETGKVKRDRQLQSILAEAAAKPEVLAALAAHMTPPYPLPESIDENIPGYSKLEIGVLPGQPDATYYVQLPPEYNPQRRYPMIVSLHGIGHDPTMQIEWWAGEHEPKTARRAGKGQAGRYGYIVIAPAWTVEHQKEYEYSAREHAVVLGCVRDACRRFAVDTDRVFLSGHMEGGDAAWDIGVSHPDLWAGVIPISAEAAEDLHLLHRERPPRAVLRRAGRVGRRPHRPRRPRPGPLFEERLQHDRRGVSRPRARALPRRAVAAVRLDEPLQAELSPAARAGRDARTGIRLQDDAAQRQLLLVGANREPAAQLHRDGLDVSP